MRIVSFDLDTLRPDHLGCYGYSRNTSPNIDAIAREGTRFDNYYCSDAPCLPSRTALWSGRFGIHTGVTGHGGTAADMRPEGSSRGFTDRLREESLPNLFRRAGFRTVSFSPFSERHSAWWFNAGFNETCNTGKEGLESAEDVTPGVLDWIDRNAREDSWFLHINYWDPHTPYRAPESFGNPFADEPGPSWITQEVFQEHLKHVGPHSANEINMFDDCVQHRYKRHPGRLENLRDVKSFFDGYDCGIRYMDTHIGQILGRLREKGIYEDIAFIVSSDHGENLGELGLYGEHATADHTTCRIPMIIKWPGTKKGHVNKGLYYNLDLPPTLAELLRVDACRAWDGQSYAPALLEGWDTGRKWLVLSQCAHVCQRSVRFGPWLYMRTYHDGYHLFPNEMLFNLDSDPHEQHNLAGDYPGICHEAAYYRSLWHDAMMKSMDTAVDPLWTVIREGGPFHARGKLKAYCQRLKQTGRGDAVPLLMERHPGEFN